MADVGVLVVGPEACSLPLPLIQAPFLRVRSEPLCPAQVDVVVVAEETGRVHFEGADADRWCLLSQRNMLQHTEILWATSQVSSLDPERASEGWRAVLVVAGADEAALLPVLRSLDATRPITVLLFGATSEADPELRRNHVGVSQMLRDGILDGVLVTADPSGVLPIALEAARNPVRATFEPQKAVDIGPWLDLPATFAMPATPVELVELVHVAIGQARNLPAVVADLAALDAMRSILDGPPMEVDGVGPMDLVTLRASLPEDHIYEEMKAEIVSGLRAVAFAGSEPLVERISEALRAVLPRIETMIRTANEIEAARILQLRGFGAAGMGFTTQRLRGMLDQLHSERPAVRPVDLIRLIEGDEAGVDAELAWRRSFAGVPAYIVRRGTPGASVARRMVKERYAQFTSRFANAVANRLQVVVENARDPQAHLPSEVLRSLYGRAVRVHDTLDAIRSDLNARMLAGCEAALASDALLRWLAPEPDDLIKCLREVLPRLAVAGELQRNATVLLTNRPLGMADPVDFEAWMSELVQGADQLSRSVRALPSYSSVILHLLQQREPRELRQHLVGEGVNPLLYIPRGADDPLLRWFERTGMEVQERPGPPSAVYWRAASGPSTPMGELGRNPMHEHRLQDLLLPAPEGDHGQALAALVEAGALLLGGLVVGELTLISDEGVQAVLVTGGGLPGMSVLPFGAVHDLATDGASREILATRVRRRLDRLGAQPDSSEALQKLVELATLGPSTRVLGQTGLDHARVRPLLGALRVLLERFSRRGLVAMLDHMPAEEVRLLSSAPGRHAILDVRQLAPLGF